jgi:GH15 family glucan-1,4-alpha-glucosidase
VRGPRRQFTHSKVMAWVAFDRAIRSAEQFGLDGPLERWRGLRDQIHREVCARGYDGDKQSFVQFYGSDRVDASLLAIPLVGFLPATDRRVQGTLEAVRRELLEDGFVRRYVDTSEVDGLPEGEGAFLLCTCWLADNLHMMNRDAEAERVLERVLAIRNDVGLLSESYDVERKRLVGNFPQAFSHVGLVNTVMNLSNQPGPAEERPR